VGGIISEDERRVTFLSKDDINSISPTKDVLLDLKRRYVRTNIPGCKDHEGHFCPALEDVTNDGHFNKKRQSDYTERTKVIFKPCP